MAKAGNLKLDFMAKSIGIHFFEFEDMFRCLRDNENLNKHFGRMYTLTIRLFALDFYEVIVDEAEGRINYHLIEIESE